jgi:hypothetical protein
VSAPTTAEVRAEIAHEQRLGVGSLNSRCAALKHYALPIAEHRDALAAEVARLREALAASEARAKNAGEGAAWVIARCKEALKLPACARNVRERQALGDVLAYTSAAKGAGR